MALTKPGPPLAPMPQNNAPAAGSLAPLPQTNNNPPAQAPQTDAAAVGANPQVQQAAAASTSGPAAVPSGAQSPGGSTVFNAGNAPQAGITGDATFGLPTNDAQILSELQNTSIYLGGAVSQGGSANAAERGAKLGDQYGPYATAASLLNNLTGMSRQDVIGLQQRLMAGQWLSGSYVPSGIVDAPTQAAYIHFLATVANYQQNGVMVTPDQLLAQSAQGGGGTTTTSTQVDLSDPETARGVINSQFESLLGRAANSQDIANFIGALQGYEEANPGTTTATTTPGAGGNAKEKVVSKTGGMGSSLSLRGGDVAAAQQFVDQQHGGEEAQVGIDTLVSKFSQLMGLGS